MERITQFKNSLVEYDVFLPEMSGGRMESTVRRWFCLVLAILPLLAGPTQITAQGLPPNQLSDSEILSGWKLLFDGKTTDGWRNYGKGGISLGWTIVGGGLTRVNPGAGDIVTTEQFEYFDLMLDYKVSAGASSGLMFHVTEDNPQPWQSGPEIQIQDNVAVRDPQKSGWLLDLYRSNQEIDTTRPAREWNQLYIRIAPDQCQVCMNGVLYYNFRLGDARWDELVSKSRFANLPGFGKAGRGHLCLQDNGEMVSFRNIKIRELRDGEPVKNPVSGRLPLQMVSAFPNLRWEGWQPVDENGKQSPRLRIVELTHAPGQPERLYAVEQGGRVYTFENSPDVKNATVFLDLSDRVAKWTENGRNEQGLLGLAFHPKFATNGEVFVSYTLRKNNHSIVSRFRVAKGKPLQAERSKEEIVLDEVHPHLNHNGGSIEFGPDDYLYIAMGDGGSGNDPDSLGQNRGQVMASILRIDVAHKPFGRRYSIPPDNPFVNMKGLRPEIYAHGFRNPWRISFDKATGRLWCADVGQELFEEINVVQKGGNYGWSLREGYHPFGNRPPVRGTSIPIDPVWEYDHAIGKSIVGGRVWNHDRLPELQGKYLYADYVTGAIWALTYDPTLGQATGNEAIVEKGLPVVAFGEDANGEIYVMQESANGQCIYRFEKN